jgi:hypothetical protein
VDGTDVDGISVGLVDGINDEGEIDGTDVGLLDGISVGLLDGINEEGDSDGIDVVLANGRDMFDVVFVGNGEGFEVKEMLLY